jgi:hypothetical protein
MIPCTAASSFMRISGGPGDHTERDSFVTPGGRPSPFDGRAGVKDNDGTVYALSKVLLLANDLLATPETKAAAKSAVSEVASTQDWR